MAMDVKRSVLYPGERLRSEAALYSPSGDIRFSMNWDGNLLLQDLRDRRIYWSSHTSANHGAELHMEPDGTLRMVPKPCEWCETYLWTVLSPSEAAGPVQLEVREDCTAVLRAGADVVWRVGDHCDHVPVTPLLIVVVLLALAVVIGVCYGCCRRRRKSSSGQPQGAGESDDSDKSRGVSQAAAQWTQWVAPLAGVAFGSTVLGMMYIAMQKPASYNLILSCCSAAVLDLDILGICVARPFAQKAGKRWVNTTARFCQVLTLVLTSPFIAFCHPVVQHTLWATHAHALDRFGPQPRCINIVEIYTCDDCPCRLDSNTDFGLCVHLVAVMYSFDSGVDYLLFALLSIAVYYSTCTVFGAGLGVTEWIQILSMCTLCSTCLWIKVKLDRSQQQLSLELSSRSREVVKERVLRYQAEYTVDALADRSLSPGHADSAPSNHGMPSSFEGDLASVASTPNTTTTCALFQNLTSGNCSMNEVCKALHELGSSEQWLIHANRVQLNRSTAASLGRGGFGQVWQGSWHGAPIAVKEAGFSKDSLVSIQSIIQELRIMRHLRHPNIALFYGVCISLEHHSIALVLEFIDGPTLEKFVLWSTSGPPGSRSRTTVMLGMCQGLRYLHERTPCVAHGDLKPSNVMVTVDGLGLPQKVKLLDFGLSRMLTGSAKSLGGGTLRWMAPERLRYHVQKHDFVSSDRKPPSALSVAEDLYSFGLLIYFTATSLQPVFQTKPTGTVRSLPPWPDDDLSVFCQGLTEPLMAEQPSDRPLVFDVFSQLERYHNREKPVCSSSSSAAPGVASAAAAAPAPPPPEGAVGEAGQATPCEVDPYTEPAAFGAKVAGTVAAWAKFRRNLAEELLEVVPLLAEGARVPKPQSVCCEYHAQHGALVAVASKLFGRPCSLPEGSGGNATQEGSSSPGISSSMPSRPSGKMVL